jgi:2-polyprenyl-3-methyl-5-hydroxy-6-metoxy-1,4-benzoquinol methylase
MTAEATDYFSNHRRKLRFPWSLYHRPIIRELEAALGRTSGESVLNIGSGPFLELRTLPASGKRFTLCDIDERAVALARRLHGAAVSATDVVSAGAPLPYASSTFDAVISMDVIEHVPDPSPWVSEALRVLRPRGLLFLTTPNYASVSLRAIEATVLEAVARSEGWSRRDLHPTKLDGGKLRALLGEAGLRKASIKEVAFGWVLTARGWK